jgi:hypothetical protein
MHVTEGEISLMPTYFLFVGLVSDILSTPLNGTAMRFRTSYEINSSSVGGSKGIRKTAVFASIEFDYN